MEPIVTNLQVGPIGWKTDRTSYSVVAKELALFLMSQRRQSLALSKDAMRGMRFYDNDCVLARLESNYTEPEFMKCPGLAVDAMLTDAARADWWYTFEKDYGDEHEDGGGEDEGE